MEKVETATYKFATTSKYKNANSCDCVIRSISLAMGKDWHEVFDGLCTIARKMYLRSREINPAP